MLSGRRYPRLPRANTSTNGWRASKRRTPRARSVNKFLSALGPAASQPIRSLTPTQIERFLNKRLDEGVAPKTAIIDVKTISIALRRAENYGLIDKNPAPAVKLPKAVS